MKTTRQIINQHSYNKFFECKEKCFNVINKISKKENKKWYSEEEIKTVLYNMNISNELRNNILQELFGD